MNVKELTAGCLRATLGGPIQDRIGPTAPEVVRSRVLGLSGRRITYLPISLESMDMLTGCAADLSVSVFGKARAQSKAAQAVETEAER
ncbi:hypothetical protein CMUS01_14619 [Colletotrichum musicola]|uniref:Uncharacterized protein n=1 Tax=Colletotrichum musicola TaxID=2175873 RepID=A0A8H6MQI0_9PEZI|nr:hypothetical protein CMUS01_14619 [Colletotrichum musicola]